MFVVASVSKLSPQRLQVMAVTAPIIAPFCRGRAASFGSTPVSVSSSELEPRRSCQAEEPGTTDVHRSGAECQRVDDVAVESLRGVEPIRSGDPVQLTFFDLLRLVIELAVQPGEEPKDGVRQQRGTRQSETGQRHADPGVTKMTDGPS